MSDSDWEVLSTDGESKPLSSLPPPEVVSASVPTQADARDAGAHVATSSVLTPQIDRRNILTPLCLTLNQTGTRLGVGHTKGFLVFRVNSTRTDGAAPPQDEPQSQLTLDPQYNVDLLTFSHVRARMRQQQQRQQQQHAATTATAKAAPVCGEDEAVHHTEKPNAYVADEQGAEVLNSPILEPDDLGSFLTAAGRAFAQLRRDDARVDSAAAPSRDQKPELRQPSILSTAPAAHKAPQAETPSTEAPLDRGGSADTITATAHAVCDDQTVSAQPASPPLSVLSSQCVREATGPSPVLEWGEDVDIDVDASDGSEDGIPISSVGDSNWKRRRRQRQRDLNATGNDATSVRGTTDGLKDEESNTDADGSEVEYEEDAFIGFNGGGVAALSFLYDQTWLALVGGGPTPMGPPNVVHLVRDGEPQHRLTLPHPIVRLFLDARLLFVVTTAELRVYTNPLEKGWVRLRQTIPMSARLASRYDAVRLAPEGESSNEPLRVWGSAPAQQGKDDGAATAAAAAGNDAPRAVSPSCVSIPSIPVTVDYARSLLLLPVGEALTDFALYRYVTGPEPVEQLTPEAAGISYLTGSSPRQQGQTTSLPASGRTTAYLQHIATQRAAHKNPLHNLVLYVGRPTDTTRLLVSAESASGSPLSDASSAHASSVSISSGSQPPATVVWSGTEHDRRCNDASAGDGTVTLVAASSEYATRITLWVLRDNDGTQGDASTRSHRDPRHGMMKPTSSNTLSQQQQQQQQLSLPFDVDSDHSFVLLREFRVGLRLSAPRVVMAALPGVSRLVSRVQPTTPSATTRNSSAIHTSHNPSQISFADPASGEDRSTAREARTDAPAASSGPCGLPADASSATHRGTVAAWAAEAASAVAATTSTSPSVQHLQFAGNGAYLLCVHNTSALSVFSTSGKESVQQAKDVTRDRAVAEHNRYSRLSMMKEYLPSALSTRLDAYTRQAWSSCSGQLPVYDVLFIPRWLYLKQQDARAAAAACSEKQLSTSSSRGMTDSTKSSAGDAAAASNTAAPGGRRFFSRLSALVGGRAPPPPQLASATSTSVNDDVADRTADSRVSLHSSVALSPSPERHTSRAISSVPLHLTRSDPRVGSHGASQPERKSGSGVGWGTPLISLSDCIRIWSAPLRSLHLGDRPGSFAGTARPPIVLNCATCEGAFANVFLFTEEGELRTSRVIPYAAE